MSIKCDAPGCTKDATRRNKFLDPRRDYDDKRAYVIRYSCCDEHMLAVCDELERVANYARLVH